MFLPAADMFMPAADMITPDWKLDKLRLDYVISDQAKISHIYLYITRVLYLYLYLD